MKRLALILLVVLVAAACGRGSEDSTPTAAVMAAAVHQLVTVDHTFAQGPPPFTEYLVLETTDPAAGSGQPGAYPSRPLDDSERAAIEAVLEPLGPVRWIDDADDWRTDDLRPTVEGAVILGIGEPDLATDTALVPVSLWCGGLCGTWLSYRVDLVDGQWQVSGTEGPIAVS